METDTHLVFIPAPSVSLEACIIFKYLFHIIPSVIVKHTVSGWKVQQVFKDNLPNGEAEAWRDWSPWKQGGHIIYICWHQPKSTHPHNHSLNNCLFGAHSPQPLRYALDIPKVQCGGPEETHRSWAVGYAFRLSVTWETCGIPPGQWHI